MKKSRRNLLKNTVNLHADSIIFWNRHKKLLDPKMQEWSQQISSRICIKIQNQSKESVCGSNGKVCLR